MPPFQYQDYRNPYAGSIAELLLRQGDIQARAAEQSANAQAQATATRGQVLGNAIASIGQVPVQLEALQNQRMDRQLKQQELQARSMALQDQTEQRRLGQQGRIAQTIGAIAKGSSSPDEFRTQIDNMVALGALPKDVGAHIAQNVLTPDADWSAVQKQYVEFGAQFAQPTKLGEGERLINPVSGAIQAEGAPKPPTTAELALRAGNGDQAASAAIDRLHPKPQPTEASLAAAAAGGDASAQTALDTLQGPTKAQRDETARHNREMERIGGLTAGREAAAQAETARHNRAIEAFQNPYGGATTGEGGAVDPVAQAIAEYRMAPVSPRSAATPAGRALMAAVTKINPSYDASQFPTRQKMRQAFTSGNQAQQLTALNTAIEHLGVLNEFADALGNGSFKPGNEIYNRVRSMFGDSAVTNYGFARDIMAGELATAMKKSGATDPEIEKVTRSLEASNSPQQLADAVKRVALPMIGGKARVMDEQYHAAMGSADPFSVYTPGAKAVLNRFNANAPKPPAAAVFSVTAPNGQTYTFPSQSALDAFKQKAGIQ